MKEYQVTMYLLVKADGADEANNKLITALKKDVVRGALKEAGVASWEVDVAETVEAEDL